MNLREWLEATRINGSDITSGERERRREYRARVLKRAKTSMSTIRISHSRGKLGRDLAKRLEAATKGTFAEFKLLDQMPELRGKVDNDPPPADLPSTELRPEDAKGLPEALTAELSKRGQQAAAEAES
ncbi:hypothetical protein [Cupriavidus pauculus]|uniref:Uncharacterized protein n=1 Tax=Cupriavidus pauculus TaxID=82633 RepID=A0A3G8H4A1_9BURK|nr:hypothetical protein [Cupriavidus pauculus]AZG14950.1 hypothetical protein EHF44_16845 [Cupriavidus pauculus]